MAKKLAKFNSSKHPRGHHGRFVETPDLPKAADQSNKSAQYRRIAKQTRSIIKEAKAQAEIRQARLDLLGEMSAAQRRRLVSILADKAETKAGSEEVTPFKVGILAEDGTKAPTEAKPKRPKLTPEEKAARDTRKAEEKVARQAERQRKAEEKAAKEKEKAVKEAERLAKKQLKADEKAAREAERAEREAIAEADKAKYEEYKARAKAKMYDNIKAGEKEPLKIPIKREPTSRPEPQKDSVTFTDKGIDIWQGKPEFGKFEAGFKVRQAKEFEYAVEHEGQKLVLNRSRKVYEYGGETVEGIPDTHHKLRELKNEQLFSRLAEAMRHTENSTKSITAPAPKWLSSIHGSIPKEFVRSKKGAGDYGEMQIHHVDQWAQRRFDEITSQLKYNLKTKKFEDGEITLEDAKAQMGELLVKREGVDKNGNAKTWWEISPKAQQDRRLVVLAAGTHEVTSPLFLANHPKGIHPETGKLETFGIPEDGDSGRDYFNAWRAGFWAQHHRREAFIYRQEINRRVREGTMTVDEAKTQWDTAHEKVVKSQEYLLSLRKERSLERRAAKAAKEEIEKELEV